MPHGEPFDAVFFDRDEEIVVLVLPVHLNLDAFRAGHDGNGRAVNICICQAHPVTQAGEGHGQVHGHGALAHTALAGGDSDDMAYLPQLLQVELDAVRSLGRRRFFHHGVHFHLRSAGQMAVQAGLGGSHQIVLQRIWTLGEGQGHFYPAFLKVYVLYHTQGYYGHIVMPRMLHFLQPLQYFFLFHQQDYLAKVSSLMMLEAPPTFSTSQST